SWSGSWPPGSGWTHRPSAPPCGTTPSPGGSPHSPSCSRICEPGHLADRHLKKESGMQQEAQTTADDLTLSMDGKSVIVTGAASGIGRRTAELFAQPGGGCP